MYFPLLFLRRERYVVSPCTKKKSENFIIFVFDIPKSWLLKGLDPELHGFTFDWLPRSGSALIFQAESGSAKSYCCSKALGSTFPYKNHTFQIKNRSPTPCDRPLVTEVRTVCTRIHERAMGFGPGISSMKAQNREEGENDSSCWWRLDGVSQPRSVSYCLYMLCAYILL
jgi:hypothetical protein